MQTSPRDGSQPATSATLTGQVLDGRFEVQRLIGRGGMSEVYLAQQLPMGRPCAIKVLLAPRSSEPNAVARFEREAALAGRLSHPNVCRVYDSGRTTAGLPYLAMEWLDGQSLAEVLAAGPLDPARAARIAADCAAGLAAAHTAGIVHRDLKPGNVIVVTRDGVETAVVTDFGIAWSGADAAMTRDGLMVGTPEVMSPEQIAGDPVDPRSDQYQLALLVCRMLTGRLPFEGGTSQETMVKRLTDPPTSIQRLHPGLRLPGAVQAVLDRGLARRPADRFPGIRDLSGALTAALSVSGDAPTEVMTPARAGSAESGQALSLAWARSGMAWASGVLALGVAVTLLLTSGPGASPVEGAPVTPPPPPPAPATAPGPPASPPRTDPVVRGAAIPALPDTSRFFSNDPVVRAEARQQAERVYFSASAPDTVRALAAYIVAEVLRAEGLLASARGWLEDCLALGERALCRNLLNNLPPDPEPLA